MYWYIARIVEHWVRIELTVNGMLGKLAVHYTMQGAFQRD